ncbi:hypothetical protein [Treponema pectinovorum]|uniref:hypothetical protein n=1 Tax=Treponema pectinovorum TaxID=164 RepID=UPI0011C7B357|nr:hypothetical protein [Treponema pectinovorum]
MLGVDGFSGVDGVLGLDGFSGVDGLLGLDGFSGVDGVGSDCDGDVLLLQAINANSPTNKAMHIHA